MAGMPIWYELMTPDPGAVAPFYRAVLGWEIPAEGAVMPNGSDYRIITRTTGGSAGGVLKLSEGMLAGGATPGWMTYFHVEDVGEATAKAKSLGASVHMPPTTMEGAGRMAMIADPQGAAFYLMDPMPPPGQPDAQSDAFDMLRPGHCWWNELETTDGPAATEFYKTLFGWTADETMPMGEHGEYRFIKAGEQQLGAINPWMSDWMRVGWLPYFGVADIETAREAAGAHGVTVHVEIQEVPGGSFVFVCTDPAGAPVAFVGPKGT